MARQKRCLDLSQALDPGHPSTSWAKLGEDCLDPMGLDSDLTADDWRRIRDALRYLGRDLHHRSYAVGPERRELLWEEMDRCLALADRLSDDRLSEGNDLLSKEVAGGAAQLQPAVSLVCGAEPGRSDLAPDDIHQEPRAAAQ